MRPATEEFLINYYKDILNAKTEEELLELKENMQEVLKNFELSDEYINEFFEEADRMVEEGAIFQELEKIVGYTDSVEYNEIIEEEQEVEAMQEISANSYPQALVAGGVGIGLTALIITLELKKKFLKNKQIKR